MIAPIPASAGLFFSNTSISSRLTISGTPLAGGAIALDIDAALLCVAGVGDWGHNNPTERAIDLNHACRIQGVDPVTDQVHAFPGTRGLPDLRDCRAIGR